MLLSFSDLERKEIIARAVWEQLERDARKAWDEGAEKWTTSDDYRA